MFNILPSRDPLTICVEIDGKATGEDAEKMDQHVKETFGENEPFNVMAIIKDINGTTLDGLMKGPIVDAKRWGQFRKFAVVSEKKWVETAVKIGDVLPGVSTQHFDKDEIETAWDWIRQ
ncbi:SpoIIAA-like [Lentibacillus persicus]|uniref:SpoIIAA-like n=1 Tax=Lentibacillus persicus TaxID=640948 RepID=A0A1I1XT47_9BACI|nr:STAS/SEC14 domain-containing protein [Lentibacillus persicus]SFE08780.1 SpoIIAA-like [Lentibacillus persicus]